MFDVILVALAGESVGLRGHVVLGFMLFGPPLLEHVTLHDDGVCVSLSCHLPRVLLPVTDCHSLSNGLCFLSSLGHLALVLLLSIQGPQLCIHMLFL